ncbi:RdgB/HAM1 family non-canonical purine NTP pyrophosphatase [Mesoplasma lactucae]|uniref:dITP/XTP pyrophosphatase n=1 Tax=Mesoplasma lactucae ATCC 49193 TaxID=81460 RepID=A0A291IRX9_9MOLU|nr:RdgB/HAM1 family non-canonical purine NTP pyrophosphatase [Mesoplasma lactucae]ATG97447.1 non-canonical purine NTP pyrophosphatase, RdgB/HAM1 family [Mesoplasma lactucae ATCC 49193]ATZ20098.1 dITP/XTP pyrophosphatase [Mesoplasma lactucae ATCC 49193]MCL8216846.1 dITP/XTP pyrophosphatase [Mesoplasma lactucae ATCC 49193]
MTNKEEIWIATENEGKIQEFKQMLGNDYDVKSLLDLPEKLDIEENGETFEQNALIKAMALAKVIHKPTIGDDSGIEIEEMHNFPGVRSKRWALPITDPKEINQKLLAVLQEKHLTAKQQRKAKMVTYLVYFDPENNFQRGFQGVLNGYIAPEAKGNGGFGYDEIFIPNDTDRTVAEQVENKNDFSHRSKALKKLKEFLDSKADGNA